MKDTDSALGENVVEDVVAGSVPRVANVAGTTMRIQTDKLTDDETLRIKEGLTSAYGVTDNEVTSTFIGPTWGADVTKQALMGLLVFVALAAVLMALYFRTWKMSVSALTAMLVTMFITAGVYALSDFEVTLLSEGNLYVAKFTGSAAAAEIDGKGTVPADGGFDGTGEWLPLVENGYSCVQDMSVEEVLVYTRLAADKVGPTKMDRCEDVEPSLHTGKVYVACTNNSDRGKAGKEGATEVNPRNENRDGHIVEITETGDQTSTTFTWNLLMVCGDPAQGDVTYFSGFPVDQVSPISCPDNLAFDSVGNLWISTDGAPSGIGKADGLFKVTLEGAERGKVEQFLAVPRDGETCGPIIHDDERTVFVSVQHPGEDGSFDKQLSFFPDYVAEGATPARGQVRAPRPSVVQVFRG